MVDLSEGVGWTRDGEESAYPKPKLGFRDVFPVVVTSVFLLLLLVWSILWWD